MSSIVSEYAAMAQAIVDGDKEAAQSLARAVVESGGDALAAIERGFAVGVRKVGDLWEEGEYFLPELVQGAETMKAALEVLRPALAKDRSAAPAARVVIGTVKGDLHDIGKSLVATLLAANGFEVHDLGSDVSIEAFIEKAKEVRADIIAASALLTTTMTVQRSLVAAVRKADLVPTPKVMIGGAPTTPEWAQEIGAMHAENAVQAVQVAKAMMPGADAP